jgi:hypothetical protein
MAGLKNNYIYLPQFYCMKPIILFVLVFLSLTAIAQNPDCSKLKNGSFKYTVEGQGEILIVRKGKTQTEENLTTGVKLTMEIVWTGDCSYQLKNAKVIKGEAPFAIPEGQVLFNEIVDVNNKTCKIKCWLNNAPDQSFEFSILIL